MSLPERVRAVLRRPKPSEGDLPEGMIPADKIVRLSHRKHTAAPEAPTTVVDPDLAARRDRLVQRFVVMQTELGGLYYEMAIRDHVRHEVLAAKAAELQRVDVELAQVERVMRGEDAGLAGVCASCAAPFGRADVFCSQCGQPVHAHTNGNHQ
jgi:hypothetical protein